MNLSRYTLPVLHVLLPLCLLSLALPGCGPCMSITDQTFFGGKMTASDAHIDQLEEELELLKTNYDKAVITLNADIATHKSTIDAHIQEGRIGPALAAIKEMNGDLHAGYYAGDAKRHNLVVKEELNQKPYVIDASKRTLAAVDGVIKSGEFQKLDTWLNERQDLPADDATVKGFAQKHEQLYTLWIDFLETEIARTQGTYPGSALIYALKARSLAEQIKDAERTQSLDAFVAKTSKQLMDTHGFAFSVGTVSGPHSGDVTKAIKTHSWGTRQITFAAKSKRTDNVLAFTLGAPSYKSSTTERTDTFTYQSGTQQVANPALEDAQDKIDSIQDDISGYQDQRGDQERKLADNSDMAQCETSGRVASCQNNIESAQKKISSLNQDISSAQEDLNDAREDKAEIPATITQPVYDEHPYPVTIHHMHAKLSLSATAKSTRGYPEASERTSITAHLTDDAHAAHSMKDGNVSADAANPPSESSALNSLKRNASSALIQVIIQAFSGHRDGLIANMPKDRDAQLHALAIYIMYDPSTASEEAVGQLEALAEFEGIKALMTR